MAEKKDAELSSGKYQPKTQTESESIVTSQKIAPPHLTTLEEQFEKKSHIKVAITYILLQVNIALLTLLCLPSSLVSSLFNIRKSHC